MSTVSVLLLLGSRRLGLGWTASAAGLLWVGLIAYSRFNLRPELFGYLSFATLLLLLGPVVVEPKRTGGRFAGRHGFVAIVGPTALVRQSAQLLASWPVRRRRRLLRVSREKHRGVSRRFQILVTPPQERGSSARNAFCTPRASRCSS